MSDQQLAQENRSVTFQLRRPGNKPKFLSSIENSIENTNAINLHLSTVLSKLGFRKSEVAVYTHKTRPEVMIVRNDPRDEFDANGLGYNEFVISEVPEYEVEDRSKDEDSSDDENSSDEDLANGIPIVIVEDVTIIVPNNFSTFDANEWDSDEDYEDYEDD